MSNIAPNGTVIFYEGVRLDPTYQNTLYFESKAAQTTFFTSTLTSLATVENISYQRVSKNVIRVQLPIDTLKNCDYMMFRNTSINSKYFYAFVTKTEYVNNLTTDVYYELDYIQTYLFDSGVSLGRCFVEREHASNDAIGANTTPEPISVSEAWPTNLKEINVGSDGYAIVCAKVDLQDDDDFAGSSITGNLCSTVKYYIYNAGRQDKTVGSQTYRGFLTLTGRLLDTDWANAADEIVSFFEFPFNLIGTPTAETGNCVTREVLSADHFVDRPTTLHGYTPRNNKLFTYPYNYLTVDNGDSVNQYRLEWFRNNAIQFRYTGALCCNPEVYLMPIGYANSNGNSAPCWSQKSVISDFPQIPYAIDSYKAWLAQTQSTRKSKLIGGVATGAGSGVGLGAKLGAAAGGVGAVAGGVIGGIVGAITGGIGAAATNTMAEAEARDVANKYSGQSTGSTELAVNQQRFRINQMCVTANQARIIDDFFDMFGYQVNRVKVPNISSRPHWNYVKTSTLNINGHIPADAMVVIKRAFDSGITFWKSNSDIGHYGLDNRIS